MPKYLCKDYLSEAAEHRRNQVEQKQVPVPHHIEFVNQYVHRATPKGWSQHLAPQDILEKVMGYHHLLAISCSDTAISEGLTALVKEAGRGKEGAEIEDYKQCGTSSDESANSDQWQLSQDIDMAMEKYMPSSHSASSQGHARLSCSSEPPEGLERKERFHPAKLIDDDVAVDDDGFGEHLLEELEPSLHLAWLLQLMPRVEDMAARLKPKMIQDPLLDDQGRPYTYVGLASPDFHYGSADTADEPKRSIKTEKECFCHADLHEDLDPLMELFVDEGEVESGTAGCKGQQTVESAVVAASRTLPCEPELELERSCALNEAAMTDLKELVNQCTEKPADTICGLEAPSDLTPDSSTRKGTDFVKLHDSGDSGIGHAPLLQLLESPCIPPSSSPALLTSTPLFRQQLSKLSPLTLTPEDELCILSPEAVKKQIRKNWEREKLFDSILALTLPCPSIECQVGEILTISATMAKLDLQPLRFDGNNELELSWDPLEAFCREMGEATRTLITRIPDFVDHDALPPTDASTSETKKNRQLLCLKESFAPDQCVREEEHGTQETELSPIRVPLSAEDINVKGNPPESDVPSLLLSSPKPPVGYLKPHPFPRKQQDGQTVSNPASSSSSSFSAFGGRDPWGIVQQAGARANLYTGAKGNLCEFSSPRRRKTPAGKNPSPAVSKFGAVSALDSFLMMRGGVGLPGEGEGEKEGSEENTVAVGRKRPGLSEGVQSSIKKQAHGADDSFELELVEEKIITSVFRDVCLTEKYLEALSKMENLALSLRSQIEGCGFQLPVKGAWLRESATVDLLKFFLKQQQKAVEDGQDGALKSCQLSACLFATVSVLDTLTRCSLKAALSHFSSLLERYSELGQERLSYLKGVLLELESDGQLPPHPKLSELVRVVTQWKREVRKSSRDKVVVVIAREFSVLSGEVLDYLQAIPGLESSVFSLASCDISSQLYKSAMEERFHHYDCLVVPVSALSDHTHFLWEVVSLLVEYEPLRAPLFGSPTTTDKLHPPMAAPAVTDRLLHLQQYLTLRTVLDLSTSSISFATDGDSVVYSVMVSENVTANPQLLHLLETRYNVVVVARNYSSLPPSKWLNWADLSVSPAVGVVLRPYSSLSSAAGGRNLIHTMTALSLQYSTCWVILYQEDKSSYELGGHVPQQISLLHASVAPLHTHYEVKVLMASSVPSVAKLVRRIVEETHQSTGRTSLLENGNWLSEELTHKERLLLSFPCLNSFSAQYFLREFTLSGVLSADLSVLEKRLPGVPEKVLKLFYRICQVGVVADTGYSPNASALPDPAQIPPFTNPNSLPLSPRPSTSFQDPLSLPAPNHASVIDLTDSEPPKMSSPVVIDLTANEPVLSGNMEPFSFDCNDDGDYFNFSHPEPSLVDRGTREPKLTYSSYPETGFGKEVESNMTRYQSTHFKFSPVPGLNDSLEEMEHKNNTISSEITNAQSQFTSDFNFPSNESDAFCRAENNQKGALQQPFTFSTSNVRHNLPPANPYSVAGATSDDSFVLQGTQSSDSDPRTFNLIHNASLKKQAKPGVLSPRQFRMRDQNDAVVIVPQSSCQGGVATEAFSPPFSLSGSSTQLRQQFGQHSKWDLFDNRPQSHGAALVSQQPLAFPMSSSSAFDIQSPPLLTSSTNDRSLLSTTSAFSFLPTKNSTNSAVSASFIGGKHPLQTTDPLINSSEPLVVTGASFSTNNRFKAVTSWSKQHDPLLTTAPLLGTNRFEAISNWGKQHDPLLMTAPSSSANRFEARNKQHAPFNLYTTTDTVSHSLPSIPETATVLSGMFDEERLAPRSSKAIASQIVRKPRHALPGSTVEHKPVKALDLGLDKRSERNVRLQSNDRIISSSVSGTRNASWLGAEREKWLGADRNFSGEEISEDTVVRSKYFDASSPPSTWSSTRVISSSRVGVAATTTSSIASTASRNLKEF